MGERIISVTMELYANRQPGQGQTDADKVAALPSGRLLYIGWRKPSGIVARTSKPSDRYSATRGRVGLGDRVERDPAVALATRPGDQLLAQRAPDATPSMGRVHHEVPARDVRSGAAVVRVHVGRPDDRVAVDRHDRAARGLDQPHRARR